MPLDFVEVLGHPLLRHRQGFLFLEGVLAEVAQMSLRAARCEVPQLEVLGIRHAGLGRRVRAAEASNSTGCKSVGGPVKERVKSAEAGAGQGRWKQWQDHDQHNTTCLDCYETVVFCRNAVSGGDATQTV